MTAWSRSCWRAFAWAVVTYSIVCGGIGGPLVCIWLMLISGMVAEHGNSVSDTVVGVLLGLSVLAGVTIGTFFGLHMTRPLRRALTELRGK